MGGDQFLKVFAWALTPVVQGLNVEVMPTIKDVHPNYTFGDQGWSLNSVNLTLAVTQFLTHTQYVPSLTWGP